MTMMSDVRTEQLPLSRDVGRDACARQEESAVTIRAERIAINWHPGLPIFARESFLRAVGDEYGWLGGIDGSGSLRCILPYTIIRKLMLRMVRFRVETIPLGRGLDLAEEKAFLNSAVEYFRSLGADMIIPATTNAIFRTYPEGADAAPYGSYIIDLSQPEETLWRNIDRIMRQNINTAIKRGVTIRRGSERIEEAYRMVSDTFKRSNLPFMDKASFKRYVEGLGSNALMMIADHEGVAQSYVLFAFSDYCAYAVYAGNAANQRFGANKLIYWEAIRYFRSLGIKKYDFVGARINPAKGSKQEGINTLKKHFGASLVQGYLWKYSLSPLKYRLYGLAARVRSGGDIVDAERRKLEQLETPFPVK